MRPRINFRDEDQPDAAPRGLSAAAIPRSPDALVPALLRWTILLVPVNWLCGTTPFWCYAVALLILFRGRTTSILEILFLWLIAALTLGLVVGVIRGAPLDRAAASIYNITIIVVLIAYLNGAAGLYGGASGAGRARVFDAAGTIFLVSAVFVSLVFAVDKATGDYDIALRTLILGLAGQLPGVFGEYGHVDVSITDWTVAGPQARVIGFGIYATEGALLFLLTGLLGEVAAFRDQRYWRVVGIELAIVVGLILMASRTTLGAYGASLLLLGALQRTRVTKLALIAAPVVVVGSLAVAFYGGDAISQWLAARNEARLGSSDTRFLSYTTAIDMVMASNPLTGLGIKPVDHALMEIPIGSHSTISSTFAKAGFIGLAVLASIVLTLAVALVRAQAIIWTAALRRLDRARQFELVQLSRCVLVILLWWITEDFDAPAHEAAVAGLCFGLFWGCLRASAARV